MTSKQRRSLTARAAKRLIDLAGASAGLLATAPLMAVAATAIRVNMGSPVLFRQQRPGLDGKPIWLVKFRTMRPVAAGEDMVKSDGVRLTRLGKILRATSLDELPTLWNVFTGDLSLVGPRPLLMQYLERYSPDQARRHDVKPGITGWAQIHGRNAISWDEKFRHDLWYVDHWSLGLDARILATTLVKVLRREGVSEPGSATMTEFMGSEEPASGGPKDGGDAPS